MQKSQDEVTQEIEKLRVMLPKVRPFTMFGDNNRYAIEAQIEALETEMDDDDIFAKLEEEDLDGELVGEWPQHTVDAALSAAQWRDGDEEMCPSESWKDLVQE